MGTDHLRLFGSGVHRWNRRITLRSLEGWLARTDECSGSVTRTSQRAGSTITPTLIADTEMLPGEPGNEQARVSRIPVGKLSTPEDVAEAIMMLVVNSYMTNQTLLINDGMYHHESMMRDDERAS